MRLCLRLRAAPDTSGRARVALEALLRAAHAHPLTIVDAKLAVTEAVENAIAHAYDDDHGMVEVDADVSEERLLLGVRDFGRGMEAPTPRPGLGLGLAVLRGVSSNLRVEAVEPSGTVVWATIPFRPRVR
jgi:anti-sigma regulatory factor (Ser/Thr protein kinase)